MKKESINEWWVNIGEDVGLQTEGMELELTW